VSTSVFAVNPDTGVRGRLDAIGFEAEGRDMRRATDFVADEVRRWGEVARALNVTTD